MIDNLWEQACERLAAQLPEQQYNTWIRSLPPAVIEPGGDRQRAAQKSGQY